ncbi:hypothetical protein NDU88_003973 [Pleurodeles waltl]|uniref:Uncharacterized protein n=1 Tax=Pleurodeles waltl TaxID=8319 RepID=A0AAV7PEN5_PLEWA|nr:hypothetical protein NDU88_003973 [Pleurodeles waltl]
MVGVGASERRLAAGPMLPVEGATEGIEDQPGVAAGALGAAEWTTGGTAARFGPRSGCGRQLRAPEGGLEDT